MTSSIPASSVNSIKCCSFWKKGPKMVPWIHFPHSFLKFFYYIYMEKQLMSWYICSISTRARNMLMFNRSLHGFIQLRKLPTRRGTCYSLSEVLFLNNVDLLSLNLMTPEMLWLHNFSQSFFVYILMLFI